MEAITYVTLRMTLSVFRPVSIEDVTYSYLATKIFTRGRHST